MMNRTSARDSIHRHPFAFSVLLIAAVVGFEALALVTIDLLPVQVPVITVGIMTGAVLSLCGVFLIEWLGLWSQLGLVGRPARWPTLLWFLPFVIYGLLPLTQGFDFSARDAVAAVAFGVLIAVWKLGALALVLYAWLPHGAGRAAMLTACFWASMHMGGIVTGGFLAPTLVLSLSYLFLAFAFVAVRVRSGLLWPLVPAYALLLASAVAVQGAETSNLAASVPDMMPALTVSLLLAGYGLVVWPRRAGSRKQAALGGT